MNHVNVFKAVGTSCFFVLVNVMKGMRQFRGQYLPWRTISQLRLKEFCVDIPLVCVSVYIIPGGLLILSLD